MVAASPLSRQAANPDGVPVSNQDRWRYYAQRALHASIWSVLMRIALRSVGLVRNIVLARVLAPGDFGLFGIALVVLSFVDRFSVSGLQSALIQKDRDIAEYLDTAWTVQALRGVAAAVALALSAPWVADFFAEPRAVPLIQVLGLSLLLRGLVNPGVLYFQREMEVKQQFVLRFGGNIVDLVVSVVAAFILHNAWALMAGMIAGLLTRLIASYVQHPFRPKPRFRLDQTRELGRYGRWIFLNNALNVLQYRGDNLIVGKLLGASELGVYAMAYSISEVVTVEIGRTLTEVAFPAYSRLQNDLARIRQGFSLVLELLWAVVIPITVVMSILSGPITSLLLGSKWAAVGDLLPFLAVAGGARILLNNSASVFRAIGKPEIAFKANVLTVILIFSPMYPLAMSRGLVGVAAAVAFGFCGSTIPVVFWIRSVLKMSSWDLGRLLLPGLLTGITVGAAIKLAEAVVPTTSREALVLALGMATLTYGVVCLIMWRAAGVGPLRILPHLRGARRGVRMEPALAIAGSRPADT
jgi:O-antigen/teichoic acid export membrane protein